MSMDASGLRELELDISRAPSRIQLGAPRALRTRIGPMLEREMRRDARGHMGNWFGTPGTEYETPLHRHVSNEMIDPFTVEAGIEAKGAGKLAHIIAHGSANNAPAYDHTAALRRSSQRIVRLLADMTEESVLGEEQ